MVSIVVYIMTMLVMVSIDVYLDDHASKVVMASIDVYSL